MADDNFDDGDDLDYYHDDPDQEINDKPDRKKNIVIGFCASVVLILSAIFYLPSSIGGSIAIDTGVNKEFGKGVSATTACSGSTPLIVSLGSTNVHTPTPFPTPTNNPKFRLSVINVSGVPTTCDGKDLIISAYDSEGNKLALFNSSYSDVYIYKNSLNTFYAGLNSVGLSVTTNTSSSFTVSFTNPASDSAGIANISIQSAAPSVKYCSEYVSVCQIGDIGPGGGKVFYKRVANFSCGYPRTSWCNFLEYAANDWAGTGDSDRLMYWANGGTPIATPLYPFSTDTGMRSNWASTAIGEGLARTSTLTTLSTACSQPLTIPATVTSSTLCKNAPNAARAYRGGGKSDWYIATMSELNQLCKYLNGKPWTSDATACTGSNVIDSSFTSGRSYYSSNPQGNPQVYQYQFVSPFNTGATSGTSQLRGTRPIRAF